MPVSDIDLFLNADDVGEKAEIEFLDAGKILSKEDTGFDDDALNITIKLPNGEKRSWTMNKTSHRMLARLYTTERNNWVGKKVTLVSKDVNVRGVMKKGIFVQTVEPVPEKK